MLIELTCLGAFNVALGASVQEWFCRDKKARCVGQASGGGFKRISN